MSLSVSCETTIIAPVGINTVPSPIRLEELATDDPEPVIVPNAQAEAAAVPLAPASLKPPINAIANGNWIGYLPRMFWSISRTEEQACALIHVNIYLTTVVGSGYGNKMMNFHTFVIKNPNAIIRSFAHDVTGSVRFTIVGANVSEALAMLRKAYPLNVDFARAFADWLDSVNINYRLTSHHLPEDNTYHSTTSRLLTVQGLLVPILV